MEGAVTSPNADTANQMKSQGEDTKSKFALEGAPQRKSGELA